MILGTNNTKRIAEGESAKCMVLDEDIEVELVEVGPERRMTNELIAAERKLRKKKKRKSIYENWKRNE